MLNDWNFDPQMSNAIRHLNNPEEAEEDTREYAQVLQVVKTVITTLPLDLEQNLPKASALAEKYNLDKTRFEEVAKEQFQLEAV
ncbi:hypothetical protein D3C81_1941840 [compost metagenome]